MNVTREIVKDLLPLYAAGEASADSRAAVEEWLRTDPELARLAAALREDGAPPEAVTVAPASGQAALAATKSLLRRRTWLMALALFFTRSALLLSIRQWRAALHHAARRAAHVGRKPGGGRDPLDRFRCGVPPPPRHRPLATAATVASDLDHTRSPFVVITKVRPCPS